MARLLSTLPCARLGLGSLRLDAPVVDATAVLGAPDDSAPDLWGPTHTWHLGGLDLSVSEFTDTATIAGITAVSHTATGPTPVAYGGIFVTGIPCGPPRRQMTGRGVSSGQK